MSIVLRLRPVLCAYWGGGGAGPFSPVPPGFSTEHWPRPLAPSAGASPRLGAWAPCPCSFWQRDRGGVPALLCPPSDFGKASSGLTVRKSPVSPMIHLNCDKQQLGSSRNSPLPGLGPRPCSARAGVQGGTGVQRVMVGLLRAPCTRSRPVLLLATCPTPVVLEILEPV